jgi:hypothetical protein
MKKTFLLFFFSGSFTLSFSQTKPSKQEIIDWIIEKARHCSIAKISEIAGHKVGCITSISSTQEIDQRCISEGSGIKATTKLENVCSAELVNGNIVIRLKNPVLQESLTSNEKLTPTSSLELYLDDSKEANITTRMVHALNDLGAINCPKVKEVY